jgi:hypothetical protein
MVYATEWCLGIMAYEMDCIFTVRRHQIRKMIEIVLVNLVATSE